MTAVARASTRLRRAWSIVRYIVDHPENQDSVVQALLRSACLELGTRVGMTWRIHRDGVTLIVDRGHDTSVRAAHGYPPDYREFAVWRRLLSPGDRFVDVGANIGLYSIMAAKCGCEVVSVEPDPFSVARLVQHLSLNGLEARVLGVAAGAQAGTIGIERGRASSTTTIGNAAGITVGMVRLSDFVGDEIIGGMKIDVEGAERLVLKGLGESLTGGQIKAFQLEWNAKSYELLGEGREPIYKLLLENSYEFFRAEDGGMLSRISGCPRGIPGARDLFALHQSVPSVLFS